MKKLFAILVFSLGPSLVSAQTLTNEPATPKFDVVKEKVSATPTPTPTPTPKQMPVITSKAPSKKSKAVPSHTNTPPRRTVTAPAAIPTPTPVVLLDLNQKLDPTTTVGDALRSASKNTKVVEDEELTKISAAIRTNGARLQEELSMLWMFVLLGLTLNILAVIGLVVILVQKKKREQADVRHASQIHSEDGKGNEEAHPEVWIAAVLTGLSWFATPVHAQTALPAPPPAQSEEFSSAPQSTCSIVGVPEGGVVYQGEASVSMKILTEGCNNPTAVGVGPGVEFGTPTFEENVITVEVKADFSSKIGRLEFVILEDGHTPIRSGVEDGSPYILVYNKGLAALREELMEKHAKDVAALDTKIMLLGKQVAALDLYTKNNDQELALQLNRLAGTEKGFFRKNPINREVKVAAESFRIRIRDEKDGKKPAPKR